ncbi:TPA: CHAP domain-containing protein [Enterococcus faecalis]|uniref:CHAP domain-containing protein n=1 Tax=Enterococcus faecalis TaxID=1351 RepID=UPI001EE4A99F|nr:CHAP domain-containing protein [Enterococcus faecalis]EHB5081937.1 CHAP domain-containing protein [Enterococcus faecalis]EKK5287639.1 glucosaminidase domain-containing protein [Enterococcus faecalis]MDK7897364.1 glucosaminidase domain-containing protein [Enterococcus faecalis]UKU96285.1 glucosaminidase domain-containing protein [Enterococcus faecalis]UKU98980.1 glucosaminidase domain-containing protein [Enterococcus faecalis]
MKKLFFLSSGFLISCLFLLLVLVGLSGGYLTKQTASTSDVAYTGEYIEGLPLFKEIKGRGPITDEHAQAAVGAAVKYHLLPSVILSQLGWESSYGQSHSGRTDTNFFGITWFSGCPYPQGSARGIGGSEGGFYMKFPNLKACYDYYGFMVASQSNFNPCVGNKDPGSCLLILGRGGYAAAGISEGSAYYQGAMGIIKSYNLTEYDAFAIQHWQALPTKSSPISGKSKDNAKILDRVIGQSVYNGECYGGTAWYVSQLGGPQLMGSGHSFAMLIGEDYDWAAYGWQVIMNPKPSDLQPGDVINWQAGGALSPGIYGHTGIITDVSNGGQSFSSVEQNAEQGRIMARYQRTYNQTQIRSLVRKMK